jgi:hypothetical protein
MIQSTKITGAEIIIISAIYITNIIYSFFQRIGLDILVYVRILGRAYIFYSLVFIKDKNNNIDSLPSTDKDQDYDGDKENNGSEGSSPDNSSDNNLEEARSDTTESTGDEPLEYDPNFPDRDSNSPNDRHPSDDSDLDPDLEARSIQPKEKLEA